MPAAADRPGKHQVTPNLALFQGRTQQVRGVIGNHQRNFPDTVGMRLAAQLTYLFIHIQQIVCCDAANRQDQARVNQLDLPLQVGMTMFDFLP